MNVIPIKKFQDGSKGDFAVRYASIGWHIIPIWWVKEDGKCACGKDCKNQAGKHPITSLVPFGQTNATNDPEKVASWWQKVPEANIAVFLEKSGLCAVDVDPRNGGIDTMDLLEAKHGDFHSDLLQFTGGGGEHRVFRIPQGTLPGKLGPGVDLKQNGYILLEPSNHVSGKTYGWEASSSPLDGVVATELPGWIKDLVEIRGRSDEVVPDDSPRSPVSIKEIEQALEVIPADGREEWLTVGMALHNDIGGQTAFDIWTRWSQKSAKYCPHGQIKAWRSFKRKSNGVTKATIFQMAKELGFTVARDPEICLISDHVKEFVAAQVSKIKEEAASRVVEKKSSQLIIPVKPLQALADFYSSLSEEPCPRISVAAALATGAVLTGRRYRSSNANWTSMQYVISGSSGIGKNYAKTGIDRFLLSCEMHQFMGAGFYTHQSAVYWSLHQSPNHICVSDEFGDSFSEARRADNGNKMSVFKALKQVYSDCDSSFRPDAHSMTGLTQREREAARRPPIVNPSLTLLGLTTPGQLYREIKLSHVEGGMMNRFVVFNVVREEIIQGGEIGGGLPNEGLIEWAKRVRHIPDMPVDGACDMFPGVVAVPFDEEANKVFSEFKGHCKSRSIELESTGFDNLPHRWRENAMRISTMLAACESPDAPIVTGEIASWSCELVRSCGEETILSLINQTVESSYQQQLNDVLASIRKTGEWVSTSDLLRKHRGIKAREMNEILSHLTNSDLVLAKTEQTKGRSVIMFFGLPD